MVHKPLAEVIEAQTRPETQGASLMAFVAVAASGTPALGLACSHLSTFQYFPRNGVRMP